MPATKVQLTGGSFQDSEGNLLALGTLKMELNQDENVTGVGQICSGIDIIIKLDANGAVVASPAQSVWGNDQMLPINSFYRVSGYTAAGQLAWGPNNQQVTGSGGSFDVGTWVPNQIISWTPSLQNTALLTNSVLNSDQTKLNVEDTASVTWASTANGVLKATAVIPAGVSIDVNSTPNSSQSVLNFEDTTSVTWANPSGGIVKATAIAALPAPLSTLTGFGNWSGFRVIPNGGASMGTTYALASGAVQTGTTPLVQIDATGTDTNYVSLSSTASAGTIGGYNATSNTLGPTLGGIISYQTRVQLQQTTDCRVWQCLVDSTSAPPQTLKNTNPAFHIVGFRYDTSAGDTGWVGYCSTDGTHFTVTSPGPAMDTSGHSLIFLVTGNGTSITFYVDGVSIGSISTNIPAATQHLNVVGTVDNLAVATAKLFNVSYLVLMDKF